MSIWHHSQGWISTKKTPDEIYKLIGQSPIELDEVEKMMTHENPNVSFIDISGKWKELIELQWKENKVCFSEFYHEAFLDQKAHYIVLEKDLGTENKVVFRTASRHQMFSGKEVSAWFYKACDILEASKGELHIDDMDGWNASILKYERVERD